MDYNKIYQSDKVADIGLIGTGAFGRTFLAQSRWIPAIRVPVVCDRNIEAAEAACLQAGMGPEALRVCHTRADSMTAVASGKTALISDAMLLMDLAIDVVVEATGMPESGAVHARTAIERGKNVVMVTKETDCVVGPILHRLAGNAGVVYSPADGDQPSLLIGLISWAQTLGLEIACAGKAGELDFVHDPASKIIARGDRTVPVDADFPWNLAAGPLVESLCQRHRAIGSLPRFSVADLCEMAIVINATGYNWDAPQLHAPVARIREMPDLLCGKDAGGILHKEGIIDMVNCLRGPDEVSMAGGVFVVVKCREPETWRFLKDKGHLVNRAGTHAMIFRPYHLLGVEIATSILAAKCLKLSTGGDDVKPLVDVGIRATRTLPAGYSLTMQSDHSIAGVVPEMRPAGAIGAESAVPYYLAAGNRLNCEVAAGGLLTCGMIEHAPKSELWELKREQDRLFGQGS
jgi:predicted homoserine dehydrogenase-like protein